MDDKAVRGVGWTMLSYGANKFVTVGTTVVLARLLVPADFGLFALALLATNGVSMFSDLGLGGALILRQDLDRSAQGTVFTLMLITAGILAAGLAAVSPLAGIVFGEPRLTGILLALSPMVLLGGVNWFHEALLQRELEFRRRFAATTAQSAAYAGTAITCAAVVHAGVWSLVAGQLAATLAYGAALLIVLPRRVAPALERGTIRELFGLGSGFLVQRVTAFLQENADFLAVGSALGPRSLGYYSMGYRMSELPYWGIADPVAKVTFPGFARMRARGEDIRPTFFSALQLVALAACPLGIALSAAADPFTRLVFGPNWLPMIAPLGVLGVWGAIRPVQVTIGWLLNSVGAANIMGVLSIVALLALVPALLLAASGGGITAVAWVMLADLLLSLGFLVLFAKRRAGISPAELWRTLRPILAACAVAWITGRLVAGIAAPELVVLIASGAATLGTYVLTLSLLAPGLLPRELRRLVRRVGSRSEVADAPEEVARPVRAGAPAPGRRSGDEMPS